MKILIFIILFSINTFAFSQKVTEIGMCKEDILKLNNNVCSHDTIDNIHFIKSMLSDNNNFIYYFFNDYDECFCVLLYFKSPKDVKKFIGLIELEYKKIDSSLWASNDKKYFIWLEDYDYDYYFPLLYIWSSDIKTPDNWNYLRVLEK